MINVPKQQTTCFGVIKQALTEPSSTSHTQELKWQKKEILFDFLHLVFSNDSLFATNEQRNWCQLTSLVYMIQYCVPLLISKQIFYKQETPMQTDELRKITNSVFAIISVRSSAPGDLCVWLFFYLVWTHHPVLSQYETGYFSNILFFLGGGVYFFPSKGTYPIPLDQKSKLPTEVWWLPSIQRITVIYICIL